MVHRSDPDTKAQGAAPGPDPIPKSADMRPSQGRMATTALARRLGAPAPRRASGDGPRPNPPPAPPERHRSPSGERPPAGREPKGSRARAGPKSVQYRGAPPSHTTVANPVRRSAPVSVPHVQLGVDLVPRCRRPRQANELLATKFRHRRGGGASLLAN